MNSEESEKKLSEQDAQHFERHQRRRAERLALFAEVETRLGTPVGFFESIRSESDDWAFMVKLAVFCEAAVISALVTQAAGAGPKEVWYEHFSGLTNARRLMLAQQLGVIQPVDRLKLDAVAQVRNSFAHEVANLGGSLLKFFAHCNPNRKRELADKLLDIKHTDDTNWTFYAANMRLLIEIAAVGALSSLAKFERRKELAVALDPKRELAELLQAQLVTPSAPKKNGC